MQQGGQGVCDPSVHPQACHVSLAAPGPPKCLRPGWTLGLGAPGPGRVSLHGRGRARDGIPAQSTLGSVGQSHLEMPLQLFHNSLRYRTGPHLTLLPSEYPRIIKHSTHGILLRRWLYGSRKGDLQTRAINFHSKGARSRELLIHIKRGSKFIFLPCIAGNWESKPSQALGSSGHGEVTAGVSASSCLAHRGGTQGWHRATARGQQCPRGTSNGQR